MDAITVTPAKTLAPSESAHTIPDLAADWKALTRQTCRLLHRLREFDLQRGYAQPRKSGRSASSCVDWLQENLGIDREAGQEALRVAYALLNLPHVEDAFEVGDLSYAKVRALTTAVDAANEAEHLDFALAMTDAQVAHYCRVLGGRRPGYAPRQRPTADTTAALAVA